MTNNAPIKVSETQSSTVVVQNITKPLQQEANKDKTDLVNQMGLGEVINK